MRRPAKPRAPQHLRPDTAAWFRSVLTDFALEAHHIRLLTLAAESFDRCTQARETIAAEGITITGNGGIKAHPAVAIERDSRLAFARLIRELDLDCDPPASDRIGPRSLRSNSGRA